MFDNIASVDIDKNKQQAKRLIELYSKTTNHCKKVYDLIKHIPISTKNSTRTLYKWLKFRVIAKKWQVVESVNTKVYIIYGSCTQFNAKTATPLLSPEI